MNYDAIAATDPAIAEALQAEENRQIEGLELIPSENFVSPAVLQALGSVATNKYAEGYPGARYYGGCEHMDTIERLAIDRAKQLFGAEHVNVQALSGAPANNAVYAALLKPGDVILGMDLGHGGHLTHGHPVTDAAKRYTFVSYGTTADGAIDYAALEAAAREHKPKLILVGYSAYTRDIDYARVKAVADEVGALTMADIAHIAGLVAGGHFKNPLAHGFDVVTSTTHKTLRGPRGGLIMCKTVHAKAIDKSVFPGFQGGPHMNAVAAKAVAFLEALQPSFKTYTGQIIANAAALATELQTLGWQLVHGGTENHLILLNVAASGLGGKEAQIALENAGITTNKNMIPNDPRPANDPSGIRLGTPAITTRGLTPADMPQVAAWLDRTLKAPQDAQVQAAVRAEIKAFMENRPLFTW
jgi:glycine hydroxymethyltransferase